MSLNFHLAISLAMANDERPTYRIAREAGLDQANLARYITTGRGLSARSLERLCVVLGLTLSPARDSAPVPREAPSRPVVQSTPSPRPNPPKRLDPRAAAKLGR